MSKIPNFEEDLDFISNLGDNPGTDDNLSPAGLKEKFDLAGNKIKKFLNLYIIPTINNYFATTIMTICGKSPTPDGDVDLTAKDVGAVSLATYTANLNAAWEPAHDGGYMQSAAVIGILGTDAPRYSVDLSGLTLAQTNAAIDGFSEIYRLTTSDGMVTAYSYRELSTALRINLEVLR